MPYSKNRFFLLSGLFVLSPFFFFSLKQQEDGSYGTEARYGPQEQKQRLLDAIANEGGIVNYRKKVWVDKSYEIAC